MKFLWRLYTQDFQVATVVELKIPPDFHFLGVSVSLSLLVFVGCNKQTTIR